MDVRTFLKDESAAVGLIAAIILMLGGIVGLYISYILVGEFSDTFSQIYTGNNSDITNGINQTTNIVITLLRLFSVGMLGWGGFLIINWIRG